jgi:Protein of unknown function (DUF3224)
MRRTANARFAITSWDEKPYHEAPDSPRFTRATVTRTYTGDIAGEGRVEYLMMYRPDGTAVYVGLERITARIEGREGTFVLERSGRFEDGLAKENYSVIPDSATGLLRGISGEGSSSVGHGMEHPFSLEYEFE